MPNPILPIPQFPNVPIAAGVPPVLRTELNGVVSAINGSISQANGALSRANSAIQALTGDSPQAFAAQTTPQWGVFDANGNLAIDADTVFSFEYKKSYVTPDYNQEQGAYQTWNKVEMPGEPRIILVKSGTVTDRETFLAQVRAAQQSLNLYSVYTPEYTFSSVSINDYNIMARTADSGATMIRVELLIKEVRVTAVQQFSSSSTTAAAPGTTVTSQGASQVSDGTVQAQAPTAAQAAPSPDANAAISGSAAALGGPPAPSGNGASDLPAGFPTSQQAAAGGTVGTSADGSQWVYDSNGNALNPDGTVNTKLTALNQQIAQNNQQQAAVQAQLKQYGG